MINSFSYIPHVNDAETDDDDKDDCKYDRPADGDEDGHGDAVVVQHRHEGRLRYLNLQN